MSNDNYRAPQPDDENYETAWKPQELKLFDIDEKSIKQTATIRHMGEKSINNRIKLENKIHKYAENKLKNAKPKNPSEEILYFYTQKLLKVLTVYLDRNLIKKKRFFETGNDAQSKNSEARAENLKFACENIFNILKAA